MSSANSSVHGNFNLFLTSEDDRVGHDGPPGEDLQHVGNGGHDPVALRVENNKLMLMQVFVCNSCYVFANNRMHDSNNVSLLLLLLNDFDLINQLNLCDSVFNVAINDFVQINK